MNPFRPQRLKFSRNTGVAAALGGSLLLSGITASGGEAGSATESNAAMANLFTEADGVISFEDRSRRKWDSPFVADLDQDGRLDVILTEHGQRARLYWNDGRTFSEPVDVVHGDTHGMAAGDYDRDGRIDLIISRGGGDGSNPRNPVRFHVNGDRSIEGGEEFEYFERSRGRAVKLIDSDNDGSLDLLHTAFPLKSQTNGANILYANVGGDAFDQVDYLPNSVWMSFRTLLTDYDNDGVSDLFFYRGERITVARGGEGHAFTDASEKVLGDLANTTFVSSIAEIDYDNDGDFDLFLSREDHPFDMETYFDAEHRRFAFFARRETIEFDDLTIDGDFKVENLQMAYPHFDVMVGADKRKLEFEVDRHGHKNFSLKPEEAEGWPEDREDKGLYIGHLGDGVWRVSGWTQSPTAAVIHNVVSVPSVTEKEELPALLFENRDGVFHDVTEELGISIPEQTTGIAVGDFDNDGWSDLFVVRKGNPAMSNPQILLRNHGGESFVRIEDHDIVSREVGATGLGAEAFDYDNDGDLDLIYGNERGRWHLYTNNGPKGDQANSVVIRVGDSPSGDATAHGATLTLEAAGNTYRRVIGATSAGFAHPLNPYLHVGLGACDRVDHASVRWSTGETLDIQIDAVNRTYDLSR